MYRNNLAALAFAAMALPVSANTAVDGVNVFTSRMASEIETRSQLNCDKTLDVTNRNAARQPLLGAPNESAKPDASGETTFTEVISSMGIANNASYSVCFTDALKGAPEAAVLYNKGAVRMIALNPSLTDADVEKALLSSYLALKAGWNKVNEGKLAREEFEKPQSVLLGNAKPSTTLPAEPPHKIFRFMREIDTRSFEVCGPDRDAKEAEGHRLLNIGLPQRHAVFENHNEVIGLLETVNNGKYAVCFDRDLRESNDLAVIYNGKARIIALKPNPPGYDFQQVLLRAYTKVQQDTAALAAGKITQEVFDTPQAIRAGNEVAPSKSKAPHRDAALQ